MGADELVGCGTQARLLQHQGRRRALLEDIEAVLFHHGSVEEAGAKRGLSKSAAWKRVQKSVEVLEGNRKEGCRID